MSQKVVSLLNKYGPMLSGELARKFEDEFGCNNVAARQALSRAKSPVNKICTLSFDKNQKFFYLESQYMSNKYIQRFLEAVEHSSRINQEYIRAFQSQDGYVARDILASLTASPVRNVKGHKLHQRVIKDLLKCRIIEEYSETHWMLAEWIPIPNRSLARAAGLEAVKKQVVNDFASWAGNINLIGYESAKSFTDSAEFANFQWALTAPSYIQPLYDIERERPGFVVADVFYGRAAAVEDIRFFLDKLAVIRTFKKLPAFLPVLIVESAAPDVLKELKKNKVVVAVIKNIFDQKYTELLAEIVNVFSHASAIISKNPSKIETLFQDIAKSEGRYNDIIGDMFELLAGYYYQHIGCRYLEIRKTIRIPDSNDKNEIDVLVERDGEIIIVECKATRAALDRTFAEKWLSQTIKRIRSWVLNRYQDGRALNFQLWSLGGFTAEAASMLRAEADRTQKYKIEFFDKPQIIEMAKAHHVSPVADILHQHFQPPLDKKAKNSPY